MFVSEEAIQVLYVVLANPCPEKFSSLAYGAEVRGIDDFTE
jgi:hypothetical protein